MEYFPVALPILLVLVVLAAVVFILIEIKVLGYAYSRVGIGRRHLYLWIGLSLLGSYVNIPIYRLPDERVVSGAEVWFWGVRHVVPVVERWPGTVVAVNLGGAVIPVLLSAYLVYKNRMAITAVVGIAVVTLVVHLVARPVRGVGIAEPIFVPPLIAAGTALFLDRRRAPALAYVSGSVGTLLGADVLNLDTIRGLGAPVASIGGAGTFDGIFLTGILAVLMASLLTPRAPLTAGAA